MLNVQIAIQDPTYAEQLGRLLAADGQHCVHIVRRPATLMDGAMVVDAAYLSRLSAFQPRDFDRSVIFTREENLEAQRFWNLGVRHLIHADCSPEVGHLIVLAAEARLKKTNAERAALATGRTLRETLRIVIVNPWLGKRRSPP